MFLDKNKGAITIEASIVFIIFTAGYLLLNSISMGLMVESMTRKALFEVGMDMSHYIQIVDRVGLNDYVRTETVELDDYKNLIIEDFNNQIDGEEGGDIVSSLLDLAKRDALGRTKKFGMDKIVSRLFVKKLRSIRPDLDIKNTFSIDKFDFSESKILENGNQIRLKLNYNFKMDSLGIFSVKNNISQVFLTDTWINNIKKNKFYSIWDESNFERGRYFASKIRSESKLGLKTGKGFDYFDKDTNTLIQAISLNIFDRTYTNEEQGKYYIKEEFFKLLKRYDNEMKKNYKKVANTMEQINGELLELNKANIKLLIILPEEAMQRTDLENYLSQIHNNQSIEFKYLEKAFND